MTEETWELHEDEIRTTRGEVVCQLPPEDPLAMRRGKLIASTPQLLVAVHSALLALQDAAMHFPPHSCADVSAARAVWLAYHALEGAGVKPPIEDRPDMLPEQPLT